MDSDLSEGRGVEAAVEVLRATNFRLRCLELRVATLENQSSEFRDLQARVKHLGSALRHCGGCDCSPAKLFRESARHQSAVGSAEYLTGFDSGCRGSQQARA